MQVLLLAQITYCFGFEKNDRAQFYDVESKFFTVFGFCFGGRFVRQALIGILPRGCVTHIGDPRCPMSEEPLAQRISSVAAHIILNFL